MNFTTSDRFVVVGDRGFFKKRAFEGWLRQSFLILMDTKLEELLKQKEKMGAKLVALNFEFKGIKHEDAHSELQDTEIRVLMDYIEGLNRQIIQLKKKR